MVRRALLLLVLTAVAWLPARGLEPSHVDLVSRGATPPDSDFLYVQPIEGITPAALAQALVGLGFVPATPLTSGVRLRIDDAPPDALAARLADTGLVRSVEADAVVHAAQLPGDPDAPPAANDPLYDTAQHAYLDAIGAPAAWAAAGTAETEDSGVLIAVVDTGVDFDHPDLVSRLAINDADVFFDGHDDDGNGCADDIVGCSFVSLATADPSCGYDTEPPHWQIRDDEGHGSFVAGVAAATGGNELGITGVAPDARILPVKVLDCTATGRISDAAAGIRYAADMGADVINISFGAPGDSPALREAVEYAQARGAIIVASAGNDGSRGITYPAAYPGVIAVAASGVHVGDALDYRLTAPFAEFGPGIDFLAPGVDLLSTVPAALCGLNQWVCVPDGAYARGTGSSFATPVVAGALALLLGAHPDLSPEFAVSMLETARHPAASGQQGRLLDVGAALQRELFRLGVPGTSRGAGGGSPQGPAVP